MGRVLVACEFSGIVRRAFAARGHDAWSCDLLPAEDGHNKHLQCDVRDVLDWGWGIPMSDRCHNTYDAPMRRAGVRKRYDEADGQGRLFERERIQ